MWMWPSGMVHLKMTMSIGDLVELRYWPGLRIREPEKQEIEPCDKSDAFLEVLPRSEPMRRAMEAQQLITTMAIVLKVRLILFGFLTYLFGLYNSHTRAHASRTSCILVQPYA